MKIFSNRKKAFIEHNRKEGFRDCWIYIVWYLGLPLEILAWIFFKNWDK